MSVGRQDYEERKERKIDAFKEMARKSNEIANQESSKAQKMGSVIPMGQPILVGHHSEGSHRALLKRMDTAYRKASEFSDKADYYEGRAAAAEANRSISGDDPEALERYQKKLATLEETQEFMKAVNKAWKQGKSALIALGLSETQSETLATSEKKPCPAWQLGNNSAEIRRVKLQIENLQKLNGMAAENIKFAGGEMVVNVEKNRVQFLFDAIPEPDKRARLKSHGFKWAPSEGAWQRQRTLNAINAAKRLIRDYFTT